VVDCLSIEIRRAIMKKILYLLLFLILPVFVCHLSAEETVPEASISGGYRFVDLSGSERAAEFEYLHDSISLGGELRLVPFPHRFHLDIDVKNRKDYFGDVSYAYKDIVLFRTIIRTVFHNLDNIRLIDLDTGTSSPGVTTPLRDEYKKYGVKTDINYIFLRFKTPDFPFHVYLDGSLRERDGTQQQRSLLGGAWWNSLIRDSQSRDINWKTTNIIIGTNSHLGPIEADISHGEKRFTVGGDKVLYDNYDQAGFSPPFERVAGEWPHSLIPELKSSTNTLKLHTSYTGRLVASATFTKIDKENKDSNAKADYFIGAGAVTWKPIHKLAFFLKYRHKDVDIDNPDTATITDRANSNTYIYQVKPSISSITDTISLTGRYRPASGLTLRAEYIYDDIRRINAEAWNVPQSTQKNTALLSANLRVIKGLKLETKYIHKNISNPAYNIEPDYSDEGRMSLSWIPLPRLNTLLSYNIIKEKRSNLHYADTDAAKNREVKRDRLMGSITFLVLKDLSVTTMYAYIQNKTVQDIEYHLDAAPYPPMIDSKVPYKDTTHNYVVDINYIPKDNISLNAGVSHTTSRGSFSPNDPNLLQPVSIDSFSELKIRETVYSASGEYKFKGGFATGIQYRYNDFQDVLDNPYDDVEDGEAHIILLTISKKW
jgi:predicted porin